MCTFISTVQLLQCVWQLHVTGQVVQTLESWSVGRCWVWCVLSCVKVQFMVWLQGETLQNETSRNWYYNWSLTNIHWKTKTLLLRVTVLHVMLLTQTAHSALTVLTEAPHINKDSSSLTVFMLFFFEITQRLFLCSHREYWLITVYYVPTYAQISGVNLH